MKKALFVIALSLMVMNPVAAKPPGNEGHGHKGGHSQSQLPPGLQKQGKLPPGWERKLNKGARIDNDIYVHAVPLTRIEIGKLPPLPTGMVQVRIEDRIVRLHQATMRIDAVLRLP